ncbi:DNA polymerase III subunit gamma/tau [Actinoplanes sp. SE50]|uniref:DNA polymerase III subunit gamma and tau n=1 Tax=Actinoplanes sp. (strain ATCC 31044 / CBS 674.73 / SE50/110) TaxID=134676 RepID=UPI00023EE091|nr:MULTISPECIES: DNA polymerase III subunit gamma and tau [unclassified Actinoplanes]AEV89012.1 DNA polymerase III subunit gamma/tau [Actinoplanes sp. SE50/110]ATO87418.1 DNA polymerase III subunit gamma/tau [Actinoplanes sp. SE50]SLM04836.1 DNA polymerase III subunit gamma and tau [Actinoplanes sp. SE50/110]
MALALYRKYRPRTFAEVIGQEHVTEPLSQALRSGRLNHAYLFSGPRGCGKTSSARILARSLNCEQGPTPEPCGVCASCRSLANDGTGSIDVIEIDAASHGGVDDARELREKAFFAPASSRYKIYVIDEAHMVSSAGFNALLKLVEEPPEYVKFIFATTEPDKVLGTIRSRTHHYPFRLIPPATLRPYLQQLTEAEGVTVEPAVFPLVVRAGGGSARDTLSVLDQLIAGAGPDGVSYARAVALLGVTDVALIDEMCDALAAGDGAAAYETIDRVAEAGHDPRRFASDLLERLRDLIVLQQVPDAAAKGLIDGPADQLEAMHAQASRLGAATLSRSADIVHNGLVEMRGTTAPRLLLELITARMLLPGADDSTGALLQRLERLERRGPLDAAGPAGAQAAPAEVRGDDAAVATGSAAGGGPVLDGPGGAKAAALALARGARGKAGGAARPVSPAPASPAAAPAAAAPAPAAAAPAPAAAAPAPAAAAPVPAAVPASVSPAEADWNRVADGPADVEDYDDAPPWDEEPPPPVDHEPVVASAPLPAEPSGSQQPAAGPTPAVAPRELPGLPQVRTVWQAFGPKHDKIQAMQNSGIGIHDVDGSRVVFLAPSQRYADRFLTYREVIIAEFTTELGGDWDIDCQVGTPTPETAPRNSPPRTAAAPARGSATPARDQSATAPRDQSAIPPRDQSAARRAAPERNAGRTESRPSRPQRTPADADDDGPPADAFPPEPTDDPYAEPAYTSAVGGTVPPAPGLREPAPTRPAGAPGDATVPALAVPGGSGVRSTTAPTAPPAMPAASAAAPTASTVAPANAAAASHAAPVSGAPASPAAQPDSGGSSTGVTSAASDWPEPARPGSRPSPPPADDDWPEPVKPGSRAPAGNSGPSGSATTVEGQPTAPASAEHSAVGTPSHHVAGQVHHVDSSGAASGGPAVDAAVGGSASGAVVGGSVSGAAVGGSHSGAVPADSDDEPADTGSPWPRPAAPGLPVTIAAPAVPDVARAAADLSMTASAQAAGPDRRTPSATATAVSASAAASPPAVARAAAAVETPAVARSAAMEAARAAAARSGNATPSSGLAAARAAAARGGGGAPVRTAAGPGPGGVGGGSAWSDGTPIGEAPYDPEYDGPPGGGAGYEGFDPGDEPLDEVIDEKTARQSSEEQAMQLLRDAFGAEKIGEM